MDYVIFIVVFSRVCLSLSTRSPENQIAADSLAIVEYSASPPKNQEPNPKIAEKTSTEDNEKKKPLWPNANNSMWNGRRFQFIKQK